MRLATVIEGGTSLVAVVKDGGLLPLTTATSGLDSLRGLAQRGPAGLRGVETWVRSQPDRAYRSLDDVQLGPAVPSPGAIYTIGRNYRAPGDPDDGGAPSRPLVYAKLPTSVSGSGAIVAWDRALTANVDPEAELGVVIGTAAVAVEPEEAMAHVFGYTCVNDMSSRDAWLDGDQWLLGKSMAGFCPVGPWVVTADELSPLDLRLGCTLNGVPIQDGTTAQMRHSIAHVISYISHHTALQPGDLIATGTPARLAGPPGPDRHLRPGDVVTVSIERIGDLTTTIGRMEP